MKNRAILGRFYGVFLILGILLNVVEIVALHSGTHQNSDAGLGILFTLVFGLGILPILGAALGAACVLARGVADRMAGRDATRSRRRNPAVSIMLPDEQDDNAGAE